MRPAAPLAMKERDVCSWKRCNRTPDITYLGYPLCNGHWEAFCKLEESGGLAAAKSTMENPDEGNA